MDTKRTYTFIPNLDSEIAPALAKAAESKNILGHAIFRDSVTKVLLLPFAAGQTLHEHTTPHQAILHILKGNGKITLGADEKEVSAGSWVMMDPGLPHSIHAETELILLLQVFTQTGI